MRGWLILAAAQAALAASPALTELRPRGAEIGAPFTLTVTGLILAGVRIWAGSRTVSIRPGLPHCIG